jgi:tRNA dimethylallyltransferase
VGLVNKLLVILGPTAVGKTALSLRLAAELGGEIVSADSRLFYRGMDIGTAKPSFAEQSRVPHHLLDICEPDQPLTLGRYQSLAYASTPPHLARGRLPIMVGGTGQYIMAVVEGWGIPEVPPQPALREKLGQLGEKELSRWLRTLDGNAAANIDPRNVRRVIRALEVTLVTGRPISDQQRKSSPAYDICIIGLNRDRELLYRRIDQRVENMMVDGLLAEVVSLRNSGYGRSLPSMSGLGYRQIMAHLDGELSLEEAVEKTKFDTHRFARQQKTWFKQDDPRIHWFDPGENGTEEAVQKLAQQWLECLEV